MHFTISPDLATNTLQYRQVRHSDFSLCKENRFLQNSPIKYWTYFMDVTF